MAGLSAGRCGLSNCLRDQSGPRARPVGWDCRWLEQNGDVAWRGGAAQAIDRVGRSSGRPVAGLPVRLRGTSSTVLVGLSAGQEKRRDATIVFQCNRARFRVPEQTRPTAAIQPWPCFRRKGMQCSFNDHSGHFTTAFRHWSAGPAGPAVPLCKRAHAARDVAGDPKAQQDFPKRVL